MMTDLKDVLYKELRGTSISYLEIAIPFEKQLLVKYQHIDYIEYRKALLEAIEFSGHPSGSFYSYIAHRKPNIAVYAGSFNPFHKGHYNILMKAERIFDKVIIAKGQNPDKEFSEFLPPSIIQDRQIVAYNGMLTEFVQSLPYDITLVRGLRNATDLQMELTQYRYFQDFYPEIKVVSLYCDKEYEHISSTAIRQFEKLKVAHNYGVI